MKDSVGSIGLETRHERNIGEFQWRTFKKSRIFFVSQVKRHRLLKIQCIECYFFASSFFPYVSFYFYSKRHHDCPE